MAKTRMALELGMGTSLRKGDYTRAAVRAVQDALWRNSVSFAEAFGFEKSDMLIDVEIGVQKPDEVDKGEVKAVLPYGNGKCLQCRAATVAGFQSVECEGHESSLRW